MFRLTCGAELKRRWCRGSILRILTLSILLTASSSGTFAQTNTGAWSLSARAGVNLYLSDFNNKVGPGLEGIILYRLTPVVSVGASIGFEIMKAHLEPNTIGLTYDYVRLHGFPLTAIGRFHLRPDDESLRPFLYTGIGAMFYERVDWQGNGIPDKSLNTSIHLPFGAGFQIPAWNGGDVEVDVGYRLLARDTETINHGGPDGYMTVKIGISVVLGSNDDSDDDSDGLVNSKERALGTDPGSDDSDGDGLKDGEEVEHHRTDPGRSDTDGDGLSDSKEVLVLGTNPGLEDTDGDGLSDGDEAVRGTDPVNPDSDGDRLSDGAEVSAGSDPMKTDSDDDGLTDSDELKQYKTGVTIPDSDQDGLTDGTEVLTTMTNPQQADSDGGGMSDGSEVDRGSNPLDPADDHPESNDPAETGNSFIAEGILFNPGSASISEGSEEALEAIFLRVILMTNAIQIIGHTDNTGSAEINNRLSLARAEAVKEWLLRKGLPERRIQVIGRGDREPAATNDTPQGRKANRRIEVRVVPIPARK